MEGSTAPLYLDHNATTPLLPAAASAMRPFESERFGNPASPHRFGQLARQALNEARATVARCLDCDADEVIFTSGATESNNLAIFGLAAAARGQGAVESPCLVTSGLDHPSVREPLEQLRANGLALREVPLSPKGLLERSALRSLVGGAAALVTLQLANHEMGAVQPVGSLVGELGGTPAHCDATQAVGKLPVSFRRLGVTTLAASAHKFHGPKGVGLLLVRKGTKLTPRLFGGHQQGGLRPGTEPVGLAVGLAAALQAATQEMGARTQHLLTLRRRMLEGLRAALGDVWVNGPEAGGLPQTLNLSIPGCAAATLLMKLDLAGVACSAGAACASGSLLPSPVLRAMGLPDERLRTAVRFSLGFQQTAEEMDEAVRRIVRAANELRGSEVA